MSARPSIAIVDRVKAMLRSSDPEVVEAVKLANQGLVRAKMLTPGAVHVDAALSNISVQYKNEEYIGTQLMPIVKVSKLSNRFFKYGKRDRLGVPDDNVGTRSTPNEVAETRSTDNYSCQPRALMDFVDELTLQNEDAPLDEMVDLVAAVNDAIDLKEEQRIATLLTSTATFGTGQYTSLAAGDRWDSAGGGDPIQNILDAVAGTWMGMGKTKLVGYCGYDVWRVMQRHPRLLDVTKYTQKGLVTPQDIMAYFGLDDFLVGKARQDTANSGQTASYGRIWGNVLGVLRVAQTPSPRTASFGYTFRFGEKVTTQWYAPLPGMSGGYYAKVGCAEDHKVVAADAGYLINTCIG